jgi:hypothetical protein
MGNQRVYTFIKGKSDGNKSMKELVRERCDAAFLSTLDPRTLLFLSGCFTGVCCLL